jgi:hypothetical protein
VKRIRQRKARGRSAAFFFLLAIFFSGCQGQTQDSGTTASASAGPTKDQVPATETGLRAEVAPVSHLNVRLDKNSTLLFPVRASSPVQVEGTASWGGPRYGGFSLHYLVQEEEAVRLDSTLANSWEVHEFARRKEHDDVTGTFEEECWSSFVRRSSEDPPCPLRVVPGRDWVGYPISGRLSQGRGYLLLAAEFGTPFQVRLNFSDELIVGDQIEVRSKLERLAAESFDASWEAISRCVEIGWCGTIKEGIHLLETDDLTYSFASIVALGRRGAVVEMCMENDDERDCLEPTPDSLASGNMALIASVLVRPSSAITLIFNASAPPAPEGTNQLIPNFVFRAQVVQFSVPSVHPITS